MCESAVESLAGVVSLIQLLSKQLLHECIHFNRVVVALVTFTQWPIRCGLAVDTGSASSKNDFLCLGVLW